MWVERGREIAGKEKERDIRVETREILAGRDIQRAFHRYLSDRFFIQKFTE
jgi:hypothetical protein